MRLSGLIPAFAEIVESAQDIVMPEHRKREAHPAFYHNMLLAEAVEDTVVDQTLDYAPERARQGVAAGAGHELLPDPNGPSLDTALRDQLGLKLKVQKGKLEMLVVQRIERLGGN